MPRRARKGRAAEIAVHLRFQLLELAVDITAEDDRLASKLAYLTVSAASDLSTDEHVGYHVSGTGPYVLATDGGEPEGAQTPDDVLFLVYRDCYGRLMRRMQTAGWLAIHGGLVWVAGRRLLVIGQKGAGKTTLMLRLLHDGHRVEGDELVFTREGLAMALPRLFHLKPGTETLIPELAGRLEEAPFTLLTDGGRITGFDPTVAGFDWRIDSGPIDGVVVLRAGHDGPTSTRPLSSVDLALHVLDHAFPASPSRPDTLRACAQLVADIDGTELVAGTVKSSATALVTFATLLQS